MRRGQESLEYLLILAAVLAIAVVVVLTANYLVGTPTEATQLQQDKYNFAVEGFEVRGYNEQYDPADDSTLPDSIVKDGVNYFYTDEEKPEDAEFAGWLTDSNGDQHGVYIDGGGNGDYYVEPRTPLAANAGGPYTAEITFNLEEKEAWESVGTGATGGVAEYCRRFNASSTYNAEVIAAKFQDPVSGTIQVDLRLRSGGTDPGSELTQCSINKAVESAEYHWLNCSITPTELIEDQEYFVCLCGDLHANNYFISQDGVDSKAAAGCPGVSDWGNRGADAPVFEIHGTSASGGLISFTGSASEGTKPYTYEWDFGDGSLTSTEQNPEHAYTTADEYTATLTVTDNELETSVDTAVVSITEA